LPAESIAMLMNHMPMSAISSLVGIVIVLATLPLLAEILTLSVASLWPERNTRKRGSGSGRAPLTVIVPAHNEEALIGRCVRSLRSSASWGIDVMVVAHNCSDATATRARAEGANVLVLDDPDQIGKGCALSRGFAEALLRPSHGVLVIDADSVVEPGLIECVQRELWMGTPALQCRYELFCPINQPRARLTAMAFYAFNTIRPRGRARLGLSAGILGNGFALHREVLKRVPYNAHSIVEDLEYHLALVRANIRVEFIDAAVVRGEMPATSKGARAQRARWEGGRLHVMRQWAPSLLSDMVRGRRHLIEPLLDLLGLPISSAVILLLLAALLPITWLRLYALAAFAVLLFHLTLLAASGPDHWGAIRALWSAPGYILWKLRILPEVIRSSRANAAWVRTERESPADSR
jgi:cellulose synthase/poly-beta-1,6-N-acetylglucosamine synthase-like glycosyltransferase